MNEQEFVAWKAFTKESRYHWLEDGIYRLNGRGAFYFTGGEDGLYIQIQKDGVLKIGDYKGAIPHIGEAMFQPFAVKQYTNFSMAFTAAMEIAGMPFLLDMLNGSQQEAIDTANKAFDLVGTGKPSVLKQIHEAQKAPKSPCKQKSPAKKKGAPDL
jgi:hypothetical protein